jgi:type I restriction enzyme M protein
MNNNILQYESKIWATADLLRGCGIKESEWPSFMMPFFALVMIESRLIRMFDKFKADIGEQAFADIAKDDLYNTIKDEGQGYNIFIFEKSQSLTDICKNDKSFEIDFDAYLKGFDGETKDLLGVDASDGEKFLDIKGVINKLKAKKVLLGYTKLWAEIDLKPFNNSEITTLEEHIKRKWADISAETAGEQYTPDDVIALIAEIIASKIEESDTLLKIYDCSCGGGNLLFGVEDRINQKFKRLTQTFGQDWNDSLYALAKIESRFRPDSKIEHGNTLVEDKFYNDEFDVVVANPPYGVSWKGYDKDIINDKTGRFKFIPSISDGQLLFMQHLISKLDSVGMGVVVHNGSTLFSGDAGSSESNIRKWMLDSDVVEAVIQLPTDEFFNTGIYTYLWVLNKNKQPHHKDKVMLINASDKFKALKKSKGSKRKEVDAANRLEIVATLTAYQDNDYARVFDKEFFYFNKQAIMLTNVDEYGNSFAAKLKEGKTSEKLTPLSLSNGEGEITEFVITNVESDNYRKVGERHGYMKVCEQNAEYGSPLMSINAGAASPTSLAEYFEQDIKPFIAGLDYKEQPLAVTTSQGRYYFDVSQETLIKESAGKKEALGCGKIVVKSALKKASKTQAERIEISVELAPDYQKDYEIIPFHKDQAANRAAIEAFMAKYISKPFEYLENVVGVEINFNKIFYKPEKLREVGEILDEIAALDNELKALEEGLVL